MVWHCRAIPGEKFSCTPETHRYLPQLLGIVSCSWDVFQPPLAVRPHPGPEYSHGDFGVPGQLAAGEVGHQPFHKTCLELAEQGPCLSGLVVANRKATTSLLIASKAIHNPVVGVLGVRSLPGRPIVFLLPRAGPQLLQLNFATVKNA